MTIERHSAVAARNDVTREASEEVRNTSELRYRRLFESAKDGILILDGNSGRIIDVNPYLLQILQHKREELLGRELWTIASLKHIAPSRAAFRDIQTRESVRHEDVPLQGVDGSITHVEVVSSAYLEGRNAVVQCNIRDLSDRRQTQVALIQTNQRLEQALADVRTKSRELNAITQQLWQASKLATMGELAASVAHELNNPLTTVALRAESALEGLSIDDRQRENLEIISQEVDRMAKLVSNLLLFSRRSSHQTSSIDLIKELRKALEFMAYYLRNHRIVLVEEFADHLHTIQADRQQLLQVFLNLITNASDAMPDGGTLIVRTFNGVLASEKKAVVIAFSDTGKGIAGEVLSRLWEPFFTTKPEGKGTGLGLSICRRAVEEHLGTIEIETLTGKGTTVRITLPA
ncbi:MAG: nitrogen regulation protein NR(II) [Pyrinomonadaceae bacterium]